MSESPCYEARLGAVPRDLVASAEVLNVEPKTVPLQACRNASRFRDR